MLVAFLLPVAYVACLMSATGDHVLQLRVRCWCILARLGIRFVMTIRNGLSRGKIIEPAGLFDMLCNKQGTRQFFWRHRIVLVDDDSEGC